jgi:hypothetical protein
MVCHVLGLEGSMAYTPVAGRLLSADVPSQVRESPCHLAVAPHCPVLGPAVTVWARGHYEECSDHCVCRDAVQPRLRVEPFGLPPNGAERR